MKNLTVQVLRSTIYPVVFMILGKILGIIIANKIYGYNLRITSGVTKFFAISLKYDSLAKVINVTTMSDLVMMVSVSLGVIFFLIKAYFFHGSHQSPKVVVRLTEYNLIDLMSNSTDLYINLFVWLMYLWLSLLVATVDTIYGKIGYKLTVIGAVFAIVFTALAMIDVQNEIKIKNNNYRS